MHTHLQCAHGNSFIFLWSLTSSGASGLKLAEAGALVWPFPSMLFPRHVCGLLLHFCALTSKSFYTPLHAAFLLMHLSFIPRPSHHDESSRNFSSIWYTLTAYHTGSAQHIVIGSNNLSIKWLIPMVFTICSVTFSEKVWSCLSVRANTTL